MSRLELTDDDLFAAAVLVAMTPQPQFNDMQAAKRFDFAFPSLRWKVREAASKREQELANGGPGQTSKSAGSDSQVCGEERQDAATD